VWTRGGSYICSYFYSSSREIRSQFHREGFEKPTQTGTQLRSGATAAAAPETVRQTWMRLRSTFDGSGSGGRRLAGRSSNSSSS
jgi:hypothetical protein